MSFSPYPDPPSEERQQPDPLGRDEETEEECEEQLLSAIAKMAYREILQCVIRGGHDPRSAIGDFALEVADIVRDRIEYFEGYPVESVLEPVARRPVVADIPEWRHRDNSEFVPMEESDEAPF